MIPLVVSNFEKDVSLAGVSIQNALSSTQFKTQEIALKSQKEKIDEFLQDIQNARAELQEITQEKFDLSILILPSCKNPIESRKLAQLQRIFIEFQKKFNELEKIQSELIQIQRISY